MFLSCFCLELHSTVEGHIGITSPAHASLPISNMFGHLRNKIHLHPFLDFDCWSRLHSAQEGIGHGGQDRVEEAHSELLEVRQLTSGCEWWLLGCVHLAIVRELHACFSHPRFPCIFIYLEDRIPVLSSQ